MTAKVISLMRPFITIAFTGLVIYLTVTGKIDAKEVFTVASTIVAFWFGERAALKNRDSENENKPQ
jgi:hypothetical protein